ncbi:hypothetical protein BH10BAC4_BH10BAC4_17340 [soil metagenome]
METKDFRESAHQLVDWMADYMENTKQFDVRPLIRPGDIKNQLPASAPLEGESFNKLFEDFNSIIMPGMTHWQHPQFFAYFPTGASGPSVLAEMLSSTLGAQCMIWLTSPAAEELEERMMEWMRDMIGLPPSFTGVIQDSSSSATLVALLTAREHYSSYQINQKGFDGTQRYRVYTSTQAHSSVDKDVKIAGFGIENLVKIEVDENFALKPNELIEAIENDIRQGHRLEQFEFPVGDDRQGAVAQFAGQSQPIALRHRRQRRHAKPGAGSQHDLHFGLRRRMTADLHQISRLQMRQ